MKTTYRKIFTGLLAILIAFSPLIFSSKTASAAACKVTSGRFLNDKLIYTEADRTKNLVVISIVTQNCVGQDIYVTLAEGSNNVSDGVKALTEKPFKVPASGKINIRMIPGTDHCDAVPIINDCSFRILAGPAGNKIEYHSDDDTRVTGVLKYDCDALFICKGGSLWNRLSDTSDNPDKTGECVVMNAVFDKTTLTFKDSNPPSVTMTVSTTGCEGKKIYLSLISKGIGSDGHLVPQIHDKELLVPATEKVSLTMLSGEKGCYDSSLQDAVGGSTGCNYVMFVGNEKSADKAKVFFPPPSVENYFWSDGQPSGNLKYLCDDTCSNDWGEGGANTAIVGNAFGEISAECMNKDGNRIEDCYALYSGLGDVLGTVGDGLTSKLSTVASATGLGDLFNRIIAFGIGIAGVLAVAMIVYEGVAYMRAKGDGNTSNLAQAKSRIGEVLLGFLLVLSIYVILRTINPDLLNLTPRIDSVELNVASRVGDPKFAANLDSIDTSSITVPAGDYSDPVFKAYMAHQQGAGGFAAIMWAANREMSSVPRNNPFVTGGGADGINTNIKRNCFSNRGCVATPAGFLNFWQKEVEGFKKRADPLRQEIQDGLSKAASETGVDIKTLIVMCRIESYNCSNSRAINSGGFAGLFQLSNKIHQKRNTDGVWETYKKNTFSDESLLSPYENSYVGARYVLSNLAQINKFWDKTKK